MRSTGEHGFIGMMVTLVPIATIAAVAVMPELSRATAPIICVPLASATVFQLTE